MKTFRYKLGHERGSTMTVSELITKLGEYPGDMPVIATWEMVRTFITPDSFAIKDMEDGPDFVDCLVIDVEDR